MLPKLRARMLEHYEKKEKKKWRITFRLPDVEPKARCVAALSSARQLYILPQSWRVRTDRREKGKTEDLSASSDRSGSAICYVLFLLLKRQILPRMA